jgi:SAM-dependent methyltransferase
MPPFPTPQDVAVSEDIEGALASHVVLRQAKIVVTVRGGVAHIRGHARGVEERDLIRRVVTRVRGVHAVWDSLPLPGDQRLRVLDIGCGDHKQIAEAIGVDCHPRTAVDVIAQIERGLPFADGSVDHVYAVHFLEHVRNLLYVMNEIHRVLKPDGVLHVMVPHWQCVNAVADPTHLRMFHRQTFKFFCRPYPNLRAFRPMSVAETPADLFADLQPIKDGGANTEQTLARFFD